MEVIIAIVGFLAGLVLGGMLVWLIRGKKTSELAGVSEADHERELAELRLQNQQEAAQRDRELADARLKHEHELGYRQEEISRLTGQLEQAVTAQELLEAAKLQLGEQFKATASDVLQASNKQFMELSQQGLGKTMEQAKGELEQRHRQFQELVKPLAENYGKLNPQIEALERQHQSLAEQTGKLSSALTDNRNAGLWGRNATSEGDRPSRYDGLL